MRQKVLILLAGVMVAGNAPAADIFSTTFEADTLDAAPAGWSVDAGVTVTALPYQAGKPSGSGQCVTLPQSKSASKTTGSEVGAKVWTDFYIIPQPFFSYTDQSPAIEANATAQIYVTNGIWYTISGANPNGVERSSVLGGGTYPTVVPDTFYHVSIYTDYNTGKWSLFVNNLPLAENLDIISGSGATKHDWVTIRNLSGGTAYLDDCQVTTDNDVIGGGVVPGTDVPMWVAITKFGTVYDPRPTNTSSSATAVTARWNFDNVVAGGTYHLLGKASPSGVFPLIDTINLDANYMERGEIASNGRYFYKLVRESTIDSAYTVTNSEVFAAYRQTRAPGKRYITGVPVSYATEGDGQISGALGSQLKLGLTGSYKVYAYDTNATYKSYSLSGGVWDDLTGPEFYPGSGMVIVNTGGTGADMVLAGTKPATAATVKLLENNWTYVAWAGDDTTVSGGLIPGLTAANAHTGDYFYYQGFGSNSVVRAKFDGAKWLSGPFSDKPLALVLKAGDGIVYRNTGAEIVWQQQN